MNSMDLSGSERSRWQEFPVRDSLMIHDQTKSECADTYHHETRMMIASIKEV